MKRVLKPIHLWAVAVGMVISGQYFGWSYGLAAGGPIGLMIPVAAAYYAAFGGKHLKSAREEFHALDILE